ncbi:hypothetical protein D3C78_1231120 [compost metagenome]
MLVAVLIDEVQLLAARVVVEGNGGVVLNGALEVVGRDVFTEDLAGDLVILEQRRPCEPDEAGIRQGIAHVE